MQKEHYLTAIKVALIVGTILNIINSFDYIVRGEWDVSLVLKALSTYCVPFFVSIYSSWSALKD